MTRGQVRIIGGKWRGRKIHFPNLENLRPTPDRIRETLFNWLVPYINNAICLDLFAGSGVLSFEALSRGAKFCVLLEKDAETVSVIKQNAALLKASDKLQILQGRFPECVPTHCPNKFNILFLDPPFHQGYVENASVWLEKNYSECFADDCIIYIESEPSLDPLPLPENWKVLKRKRAGEVSYSLVKRNGTSHGCQRKLIAST